MKRDAAVLPGKYGILNVATLICSTDGVINEYCEPCEAIVNG